MCEYYFETYRVGEGGFIANLRQGHIQNGVPRSVENGMSRTIDNPTQPATTNNVISV